MTGTARTFKGSTLGIALVLSACASLSPQERSAYDQAASEVQQLQTDPLANQAASDQLHRARDDLSNAATAASRNNGDDVRYWSYLAAHEAQVGEAQIAELRARHAVADASAERDRILLETQNRRVELAQQQARRAQEAAQTAQAALQQLQQQQQSQQAQEQIAQAQQEAQQAEQRAQQASQQAQDATQQAQQQVAQVTQQAAQATQQAQEQAEQATLAAQEARQQAQRATQQAQQQAEQARVQSQQDQQQLEQARRDTEHANQQLQELQARETARGMVLTLSNSVLFGTNSDTLEPGAERLLRNVAGFLQQHPAVKIRVEGFTDSRGSDALNDALSQRRAEAVARALQSEGVEPGRLEAIGRGNTQPMASNGTSAGRLQNRRVEIVFSNLEGQFSEQLADRRR